MKQLAKLITAVTAVVLFVIVGYYVWDTFRQRTTTEKLATIIHLEDQRVRNSVLEEFLVDDTARVRQRATLAVGRIGGPGAGRLLTGQLADPAPGVARTAAFAFGLLDDPEIALPLLKATSGMPSMVVAEALMAAGRLADSTQTAVAEEILKHLADASPEVREAACYALFYAGAKKPAETLILHINTETIPEVQTAALFTLARLGVTTALPVFKRFHAEGDEYQRALALRGLRVSKTNDIRQTVASSLNDGDHLVVAEAIATLQNQGGPVSAGYLAGRLKRENDEKLIVALMDALRALESNQGLATARMHLNSELTVNITIAAIRYIAAIDKERAISRIDSLLAVNPPARVRAACAEAYGDTEKSSVIPRIAVLFADEDPLVRASAFDELVILDSTNIEFYINKALADPDMMPVVLAIDQIGNRRMTAYLPQLADLMFAAGQTELDIRRSIMGLVTEMADSLRSDSVLNQILIYGALDPEYIIRREAAVIYREHLGEDRSGAIAPAGTRYSERKVERALLKYVQNPSATIITEKGEIELRLLFDIAPLTVMNFIELADDGFYDGLVFHRVVPNFVVQGGDPRGDGWGGPPYFIRCEYSDRPYKSGTVGIATSGKDTGGSQFFITHSPQPHLNARYTVFGQVLTGMDVANELVQGDVIQRIIIHEE